MNYSLKPRPTNVSSGQVSAAVASGDARALSRFGMALLSLSALLLTAIFAWAYWPTLRSLYGSWTEQPDYSHGFLVVPLAVWFLWLRRSTFPWPDVAPAWGGLGLLLLSLLLRMAGALFFIKAFDGWAVPLWVGGAVWLLGGWKVFRWTLPAIIFLFFMVPLPFHIERVLSVPLQHVATETSTFLLQLLGQPALPEGHTILLGDQQLEVERACAGLRIFMSIVALAYAYIVVTRRRVWEMIVLLISAAPIALLANSLRIVVTGLLYQYATSAAARTFSHDGAGWFMIPLAAGMFALVLWFLNHLLEEQQMLGVADLVQQRKAEVTR